MSLPRPSIRARPRSFPAGPRTGESVALVAFLLGPSGWLFQKYAGLWGLPLFGVAAILAIGLLKASFASRGMAALTQRQIGWLVSATLLGLAVLFYVLYPLANSGSLGAGSDRDEALNMATRRLMNGLYPYDARTSLGNPVSPLPGSLLLAVPFVWLGNSAYQNLFWLWVFFLCLAKVLKDQRSALVLLLATLTCSPATLHEFVTGGDLLANSIYVWVFAYGLLRVIPEPRIGVGSKILSAVLFGVGLSSRVHFLLVVPLVFAGLAQRSSLASAVKYGALALGVWMLTVVPFYGYDPGGFTPLHTLNKLHSLDTLVPHATLLTAALAASAATTLAVKGSHGSLSGVFRNCALALAFPVGLAVMLRSIQLGQLDVRFSSFALSSLCFGVAAFAPSRVR